MGRGCFGSRFLCLRERRRQHALDLGWFDAAHERAEAADRLARERPLRLLPGDDWAADQFADLRCERRQHGRQVDGDLPE